MSDATVISQNDLERQLMAEFTWIIEKLGIGFGITLNPDQP